MRAGAACLPTRPSQVWQKMGELPRSGLVLPNKSESSDLLGHASVTTTQVYLKSNPRRMREAIETAAESTVMPGADYYSPDKKAELLAFLDMLA